jgi:hypothetical protein
MTAAETQAFAVSHRDHLVKFYERDSSVLSHPHRRMYPGAGEHDALVRAPTHELAASFPAECESPGRARRLAANELRRWGHEEELVSEAALVLSELASNAVIHASSPFTINVRSQDSLLRIAVRDEHPALVTASGDRGLVVRAPHGLAVIQALATNWGVEDAHDGKIVWAELRIV